MLDGEDDRLIVGGELRFRVGGVVDVDIAMRDRHGTTEQRVFQASYSMIDDDTVCLRLAPDRMEVFQLSGPDRISRVAVIGDHPVWEDGLVANRQP